MYMSHKYMHKHIPQIKTYPSVIYSNSQSLIEHNGIPRKETAREDCCLQFEMTHHRWSQGDKEYIKLFTYSQPKTHTKKNIIIIIFLALLLTN